MPPSRAVPGARPQRRQDVTWLGPSWWAPGGGRGCAQGDVCPQGLSAPEGRTLPAQTVCSGPSPWGSGRGAPSSGRGWSLRLHILVFNPPAASSQRLPRKAAPREPPSGSPSFSRVTSEPPKPWREDLKTQGRSQASLFRARRKLVCFGFAFFFKSRQELTSANQSLKP